MADGTMRRRRLSATTGMRLYVDGNFVAANPNVTFAYTYPQGGFWRIGEGFNGIIDDLQIWKRRAHRSGASTRQESSIDRRGTWLEPLLALR
jgi:hypothetical protein